MISRADLLTIPRADAPGSVLGVPFVAIGLAAIALHRLRSRGKDPVLLWFGLFGLLYGIRLIGEQGTVRLAAGVTEGTWRYIQSALTYFMPLPAMLFRAVVFASWRPVLRWLIRGQIAFAVLAVAI